MEAGQLDRSLEDMRNANAENPATATWKDGLGNSPGETANALYRALSDSDRDQDASALKDLLAQHGVQIGIRGGGRER